MLDAYQFIIKKTTFKRNFNFRLNCLRLFLNSHEFVYKRVQSERCLWNLAQKDKIKLNTRV